MAANAGHTPLNPSSSVAAVVPHYNCHAWLGDCLSSLVEQTRPLDAIIVLDDASHVSPAPVVSRFPQVSLLASTENVGPYRLLQQIINDTAYDAYLLNDADDWSAAERLYSLLLAAERARAEMVGSQEVRVLCNHHEALCCKYPLDVNAALARNPTRHALLHGTSIISRALVHRVGGFSTGMRFGADTEFLQRASHVARIINVPDYCYFRREWSGALTASSSTGFGSPARIRLEAELRDRATQNAAALLKGLPPDLEPLKVISGIELTHVCGPQVIRTNASTPVPTSTPFRQAPKIL